MNAPRHRSISALLLLGLSLALGWACKRPETALRERSVQRVELVQTVKGMTPEEERAVVAQLSEGLGVPPEPAKGVAGPSRVFRLTLEGRPNSMTGRGLGSTCAISAGLGALVGVVIPGAGLAVWATWRSAAIAAGAGGLLGLGYGPTWYRHNAALQQELGYLPWGFSAQWEVLERSPRLGEEVVAASRNPPLFFGRHTPYLDLKPHLKPLPPESRSEAAIRQASLRAYVEALVKHFQQKD
ncbi:MAG: hypothetical protein P4L11_03345 [Geothrix sp.]|nr:hypothetical protein [Geothrix sp.]